MSAVYCDVQQFEVEPAEVRYQPVFYPGGELEGERHCPHCKSIVYCRRHQLCGVCGQALPFDCLFSGEQSQNIKSLLQRERARHRLWLQRANGHA